MAVIPKYLDFFLWHCLCDVYDDSLFIRDVSLRDFCFLHVCFFSSPQIQENCLIVKEFFILFAMATTSFFMPVSTLCRYTNLWQIHYTGCPFWGEANHLTNRNFFGTPDTIYVQWVSFFKITMLVIIYIYINTTLNNLLNWPYLLFLSLYEGLSKHQSLYLSSTAIWEFEPVDYFLIKAKKYVKLKILIVLSSPIASSFPIFSQSKTWKTIVLFIISLLAT